MMLLRFFRWTASIQVIVSCVAKANARTLRPDDNEEVAVVPSLASRSVRSLLQEQRRNGGCRMMMMTMRCRTPTRPRRVTASPTAKPSSKPSSLPSSEPSSMPSSEPSQSPTADACPSYLSNPNGVNPAHLYGFINDRTYAWTQAQERVRTMKSCCGGVRPHLVSIGSAQENAFVLSILPGRPTSSVWLGLTNLNQSNADTFEWDGTNETFVYHNWCGPVNGFCFPGKPDQGPNACAYMVLNHQAGTDGTWADVNCNDVVVSGFVFEYDCV